MVSSCVIVDDSGRFLELARALLERDGIKVVSTACSAAEGLSRVTEWRPDVALVDIDLGTDNGFDAGLAEGAEDPSVAVMIGLGLRPGRRLVDAELT